MIRSLTVKIEHLKVEDNVISLIFSTWKTMNSHNEWINGKILSHNLDHRLCLIIGHVHQCTKRQYRNTTTQGDRPVDQWSNFRCYERIQKVEIGDLHGRCYKRISNNADSNMVKYIDSGGDSQTSQVASLLH